MLAVRLLLLLPLCVTLACKGERPTAPAAEQGAATASADQDEAGSHRKLPTRVKLLPEVMKAAGVHTAEVREERLSATVELVGEVAADVDRAARVAARLSGRIASVHVREGDHVEKGALLCVLDSQEVLRARASLLSAQARGKSASENAERLSSLAQSGAASKQEATAAGAELAALRAEAQAAEQTLRTFGAELDDKGSSARVLVRAPIAGYVVSRSAVVGQTVMLEHVLFEIMNLEQAYFVGRLFEKNLARVQTGAAAEVRLHAYPEAVFVGVVESIGRQLDPTARTVVARIRISDKEDRIKVGLFGSARVTSNEPVPVEKQLVVPLSALIRIAERDVVFVRQPDGDFAVHPVTLGRTAAGRAEVLSGLRPGEQVVVEGAFNLKSVLLRHTLEED